MTLTFKHISLDHSPDSSVMFSSSHITVFHLFLTTASSVSWSEKAPLSWLLIG